MKKEILVNGNKSDIYNAGVYCLKEIDTDKVLYVGSSKEMNDAKTRHTNKCKYNKYNNKSKQPIQNAWNNNNIALEVLKISASSPDVKNANSKQEEALREALSRLEMFYIDLFKPVCNVQTRVTHSSSNKDESSTYKRKLANSGEMNPNCSKFTEQQIREIKAMLRDEVPYQEIAEKFNTTYGYISHIKNGYRWKTVEIA